MPPLTDEIKKHRRELLDRSTRSRLLNTPLGSRAKILEIVGENPDQVYSLLVKEGKSMSFLPHAELGNGALWEQSEGPNQQIALPQPNGQDADENGILAEGRADNKLQTKLGPEKLQRRLLQLFFDARNLEEEQGVNIMYLALGFLKWCESDNSDKFFHAPLILLPVALDRKSATSRFRVSFSGEDLAANFSLQARLKEDFAIDLPDLPENPEELIPSEYFNQITMATANVSRWEVIDNPQVLGLFSFSKFLMFRDLDPDSWPEQSRLEQHPMLMALLRDGFSEQPPLISDEDFLDDVLQPADLLHVIDADSSQTIAIEEVNSGKNLVIQGPPGTGKSQTIVNLIAAAVHKGRKVLFLAEKMAALEVVKCRLDEIKLGDMCLELHSHKARKRAILEELKHTFELGRPENNCTQDVMDRLCKRRNELNAHVKRMNTPIKPSAFTPYQIIGQLVQLQAKGIPPQDYKIPDAVGWTRVELTIRENCLENLVRQVRAMGCPDQHPWRGCTLEAVLPQDVTRLGQQIRNLHSELSTWKGSVDKLAAMLKLQVSTIETVEVLIKSARMIEEAPPLDGKSLKNPVWHNRREEIPKIVKAVYLLNQIKTELAESLVTESWEHDLSEERRVLKSYETSFFRIFFSDYRNARKTLRGYFKGIMPKNIDMQIAILDNLESGKRLRAEVKVGSDLGTKAFGRFWNDEVSDWQALSKIVSWERKAVEAELPIEVHEIAGPVLATKERLSELIKAIGEGWDGITNGLRKLMVEELNLDLQCAFGKLSLEKIEIAIMLERLSEWLVALERIHEWIAFTLSAKEAKGQGLGELVNRTYNGRILPDKLLDSFRHAFFEELMRKVYELYPELAQFNGSNHEAVIREFRNCDRERMLLARHEILLKHFRDIPRQGGVGEVGVLRREMNRQRNHLPIRQLMKHAGRTIQMLKPVFMMSPMSVAQYLEPGKLNFDLLLIDEASQVKPVEALGAIARSGQIVVVGDGKQLPPTSFFERLVESEENEDAQEFLALGDVESILVLCKAQGIPDRMLRWHYRSRHESLIAVSNHQFYENKLFIVPSANDGQDYGLRFHRIQGTYDRGQTATNRQEAKAVAEAVIEHARKYPNLNLGVGTFSIRQRDAIRDELELLRRSNPDLEYFFSLSRLESFFIKNLESIQGDERDVIFISVGYAKDANGYMSMNFGPLSTEGGERRLNVLITRAKCRCEVFSSISADDIDLERARSFGVSVLKMFLSYAEKGHLDIPRLTGRDPDSAFEEEVAKALIGLGYEVEYQVGMAGFFIDLAIRDKNRPSTYLIGIECDGATYHSSRSARDRDRLRQEVLESRGWKIHRVWSTDWFNKPEDELRRIKAAIDTAKAGTRSANAEPVKPATIKRETTTVSTNSGLVGVPYKEAHLSGSPHARWDDPGKVPLEVMVALVKSIVEEEEPIHKEEISRRVATALGKEKAGARVMKATTSALRTAISRKLLLEHQSFYSTQAFKVKVPRDRSNVMSPYLRKPEMISPLEYQTGIYMVVKANVGLSEDEIAVQVARLFGFNRTGDNIKKWILEYVELMVKKGWIIRNEEKYYCNG